MAVRTAGTAVGSVLLANPPAPGSYTYVVSVTDVRGNTGTAQGSFVLVAAAGC
jgi:hypothetical protein